MDGYPADYEVEGQRSFFDDTEDNAKDRGEGVSLVFIQDDAFDYPVMTKKGKGNGE